MSFLKKITDYIFFSRPILFFPGWTSFLLFVIIIDISSHSFIDLITKMSIMALTMASGFIINQIYDIESDKINEKCFYLYEKLISLTEAKTLAFIFFLISFFCSLNYSNFFIFINIGSFLLGLVYSLKPFDLKDKALANILTQTLMGVFATSYAIIDFSREWEMLLLYNIINAALCILTTIPDIKGDIEVEKVTIAVKLGEKKSSLIAFILIIIGSILTILLSYNLLLMTIYYVFVTTFLLYFLIAAFKIEYLIKVNLLVQALIVSYFYYFYFILVVLMYFLGRMYFKKRFNIKYPQLFEE